MSNWNEALHPRGEGSRFVTSDSQREEHEVSPYAVAVAPARHTDWRAARMDARTGYSEPVMVDGYDIANTAYDQLPKEIRSKMERAVEADDYEGDIGGSVRAGGDPQRIAREVVEHEAQGGTIDRDPDGVIRWRLADGSAGRERGMGAFAPDHETFYVGSSQVFTRYVNGDVIVEGHGELRNGKARFYDDRNCHYVAPDGVAYRDGRVIEPEDSEFHDVYRRELEEARAELNHRANTIEAE